MPPFSDREGSNDDRPEPQCKLCGGSGILTDDSSSCRPCPLCYLPDEESGDYDYALDDFNFDCERERRWR